LTDLTKTLADQIREIDKLVEDGMDRLAQAHFALRSLQSRVEDDGTQPEEDALSGE
jgi:hypothetical protein